MTDRQHRISATIAVAIMFVMFSTVGVVKQSIPWLFVGAWLGLATAIEISYWGKRGQKED